MDLRHLLSYGNYIVVNKPLVKQIGLEETILLGELCNESLYWENCGSLDSDGYFFSTQNNIEENLQISPKRQRVLLNKLQDLGLISVKVKGCPPKRYIKINNENLVKLIVK